MDTSCKCNAAPQSFYMPPDPEMLDYGGCNCTTCRPAAPRVQIVECRPERVVECACNQEPVKEEVCCECKDSSTPSPQCDCNCHPPKPAEGSCGCKSKVVCAPSSSAVPRGTKEVSYHPGAVTTTHSRVKKHTVVNRGGGSACRGGGQRRHRNSSDCCVIL